MSITIKVTFLAGRYHATPWGRHVNEGVPEWPPSPWRILRALVAVWQRTCPIYSAEQVRRILTPLAQPPRFFVPAHSVAHTRHYMPWEKKGPTDRTMVIDTFVSVSREEPLFVGWAGAELCGDDRAALSVLVRNLATIGRSETWVEAELCDAPIDLPIGPADSSDVDHVRVLCPDPEGAFGDEYFPMIDAGRAAKGKLMPRDFISDCPRWHLCLDTQTIHEQKWTAVPGARWVNYIRPTEGHAVRSGPDVVARASAPTVARFLLDGPVLPRATEGIQVAEALRRAAMSQFRRWCERNYTLAEKFRRCDGIDGFVSRTLSGKEPSGEVRKDHRHAFYLPTCEGDNPQRVTHVTVVAGDGFLPGEVAAFNAIRRLPVWASRGDTHEVGPVYVRLVGLGVESDFRTPLLQESSDWVSATPFVATRHPKIRGRKRDSAQHLASREAFVRYTLRRELDHLAQRRADMPAVLDVTWLDTVCNGLRPFDFSRFRQKRGDDGGRRPCGAFRILLAAPVRGPLCLGHSSHFGLGLFVPEAGAADSATPAP